MLNRPNQSKSNSKGTQTSQSKTTAKWKTYDEPVQIPILMYHAVHVMDPSEASNANLIVDPDLFEAQIKALSKAGYYFLTPEEAYKAFTENALPAKKVVWLTFDDGNEDFYTTAYPILKKYKAKATNNIITGFVKKGNAGNLTVKQMKEMMAHGMSFQSHTVNHPDLSATDKATQKVELTDSIDFLENKLNTKVNTIAYPSGRYNQTTLDLAKKTYKLGLTTNEGLASAKDGLLSLNRVRILPTTTAKGLLSEIATDND
ncbi:MAG: polysaccharide deacetylase family protein [Streptococcus salivarius]